MLLLHKINRESSPNQEMRSNLWLQKEKKFHVDKRWSAAVQVVDQKFQSEYNLLSNSSSPYVLWQDRMCAMGFEESAKVTSGVKCIIAIAGSPGIAGRDEPTPGAWSLVRIGRADFSIQRLHKYIVYLCAYLDTYWLFFSFEVLCNTLLYIGGM